MMTPHADSSSCHVTIVVPVFNEESNILPLIERVAQVMPCAYDILFVDDGSSDGTLAVLQACAATNPHIGFCSFSRNYGHQAAIKAGLDHAKGDCVITMDGDMQHPPELLPVLLERWMAGADVVNTRRMPEAGQSFVKQKTSGLFYRLLNACSGTRVEPGTADFRLLDRRIVEICRDLQEDAFFWRGLVPWLGFRQDFVDYLPQHRLSGTSKYTFKKMFRLAWDGISSFSLLPLRMASVLGGFGVIACVVYSLYVLLQTLFGHTVSGWASMMIAVMGIGSLQMIFLGILGEYVGKIFLRTKHRPVYLLKEKKDAEIQ